MQEIKSNQTLITIFFISLVIFFYYEFIFLSQIEYFKNLSYEVNTQVKILDTKNLEFDNIKQNKIIIEKNESEIKSIKNKIPQYIDLPEIVINLNSILNSYNITVNNIKWGNYTPFNIDESNIYEISLELTLAGEYSSIKNFIEYIKTSERIYSLKKIQLNNDNINIKSHLKADLIISSYFMVEKEGDNI